MYGIPYAAVKLSLSLQKQIGVFLNCLFFFFAVHSIGHGDPKSFWGDNFPFSDTTSDVPETFWGIHNHSKFWNAFSIFFWVLFFKSASTLLNFDRFNFLKFCPDSHGWSLVGKIKSSTLDSQKFRAFSKIKKNWMKQTRRFQAWDVWTKNVETPGFDPGASRMRSARSTNWATLPLFWQWSKMYYIYTISLGASLGWGWVYLKRQRFRSALYLWLYGRWFNSHARQGDTATVVSFLAATSDKCWVWLGRQSGSPASEVFKCNGFSAFHFWISLEWKIIMLKSFFSLSHLNKW